MVQLKCPNCRKNPIYLLVTLIWCSTVVLTNASSSFASDRIIKLDGRAKESILFIEILTQSELIHLVERKWVFSWSPWCSSLNNALVVEQSVYVFLLCQTEPMFYSHQCLQHTAKYVNYNWNSTNVDWRVDYELIGSLWKEDRYEMAFWITIPKDLKWRWSCAQNKVVLNSSTVKRKATSIRTERDWKG